MCFQNSSNNRAYARSLRPEVINVYDPMLRTVTMHSSQGWLEQRFLKLQMECSEINKLLGN
jgi:hypothetical protein